MVISLCCLKNHAMAAFTGGIKNIAIGTMPGKIYGNTKKTINRAFTISHSWDSLQKYIHDSYICKPVQFVLTDGLQGSAYGPHAQGAPSYEAAKMNMRLVIASKDPLAIDTVHACMVGVDPEKVDYLRYVAEAGLGTMDTSRISVVGNARVDEVKKSFPMAEGLARRLWSMPSKARYSDYDAPQFAVKEVSLHKTRLEASLSVDSKIDKLEVEIDGHTVITARENFERIRCELGDELNPDAVTFKAYDRFFNCRVETMECRRQAA